MPYNRTIQKSFILLLTVCSTIYSYGQNRIGFYASYNNLGAGYETAQGVSGYIIYSVSMNKNTHVNLGLGHSNLTTDFSNTYICFGPMPSFLTKSVDLAELRLTIRQDLPVIDKFRFYGQAGVLSRTSFHEKITDGVGEMSTSKQVTPYSLNAYLGIGAEWNLGKFILHMEPSVTCPFWYQKNISLFELPGPTGSASLGISYPF